MRCIRILLSLLAFACFSAMAVDATPDMYTARVLVTSRSDDAKTAGFQAGLTQVYMKLAAKPDIKPYRSLVASLAHAPDWVDRFQYQQTGDETYMLIRFNEGLVKEALQSADLPFSDTPRPRLVAWVAMNVQNTPIVLTEQQVSPQAILVKNALMNAASRWGMNLVLPSGDMAERVTPNDIGGAMDARLQEANGQYFATGFMAITLAGQDPQWQTTWHMSVADTKTTGTAQGTSLADTFDNTLVSAAAALIAQPTAAEMGTAAAWEGAAIAASPDAVTLVVSRVGDLESYMRIDAYLNTLPGVAKVETVEMNMPTVMFRLTLQGASSRWKASLASEQVLALDRDSVPDEPESDTFYYHYVAP